MSLDRRSLLRTFATAGAAAVAVEGTAQARVRPMAPADALGLLYDTSLCIGCKSCVVACREANNKKADTKNSPLWDEPMDLNGEDGIALIRKIRANVPGLPIIAIGDRFDQATRDFAQELGIAELLQKPITPEWKPVVERVRALRARA